MNGKSFADRVREDRRLLMLRILSEQSSYRCNTSNLYTALDYWGVPASRDDVLTDSRWLGDQGLVHVEELVDRVWVLTLTSRGNDVVVGKTTVPGVSRPSPR
jgi:hypothetical protein